ncbi:hypothetical protein ACFW04_004732 [Cataglyphis niger]
MLISRNISVTLRKLIIDLSCSAKNLHSSCRQYLYNNPLSMASVKVAYTLYESVEKHGWNQNAEQPIIIMHCLFSSKNNWDILSKTIHQKTKRKVIAVDARNHGDSPHTSNMSYEDMTEDVIQLLNNLEFEKAILLGHSMGALTAMYTALNFPQHVEKLAIIDMSPIRSPSSSLLLIKKIFEAMSVATADGSPTLSEAFKIIDQQLEKSIKSSTMRQFLIANLVEMGLGKYKWRLNLPVLEQTFSTNIAVFPKIDSKSYAKSTLFICGANSEYVPMEDHDAIKKLFPLAEFRYIEGANHWVHVDKPIDFIDVLTNFINRSIF